MLPLVEIPTIVQHYAHWFEPVFSEQAMIQFQRYLSGLLVLDNKTVDGINNAVLPAQRNQSSLNRFLTKSPFCTEHLNQRRLALLNSLPGTQIKPKGVLSIDDTLLSHYGDQFDGIANLYDPTEEHYTWAHNLVNLHYSDDATDYPLLFQLWRPFDVDKLERELPALGIPLRASKFALKESAPKKWRQYLFGVWQRHCDEPAVAPLYESKLTIAQQLLRQWVAHAPAPKLPVTFDNWYTQPGFCRFLVQELGLDYVGTLGGEDPVLLQSGPEPVQEFAARLKREHQEGLKNGQPLLFRKIGIWYKGAKEVYYSYCQTHRIHRFGKQRLVINYHQEDLADEPTYFISNRLNWHAPGITRIRRHRWPVEVYHEEGKAEGLDQYQVRDWQAIVRHIGLVAVAYSILRSAPHDEDLLAKLRRQLELKIEGSAAFWRRATNAQLLWVLACFIAAGLTQGQSLRDLMAPLLAATCH
jgi:hypothetical protein